MFWLFNIALALPGDVVTLVPPTLQAEGLTHSETLGAIDEAAAFWNDATCVGDTQVVVDPPEDTSAWVADGRTAIVVSDPNDDLEDGVLGATLLGSDACWIVLNDGVAWQQVDLADFLIHELSHLLTDYVHSPSEGSDRDASLLDLRAARGQDFELSCDLITVSPGETVSCSIDVVVSSGDVDASWTISDGTTASDLTIAHAFEQAGSYDIEACATSLGDDCPLWCEVHTVDVSSGSSGGSGGSSGCTCDTAGFPASTTAFLFLAALARRRNSGEPLGTSCYEGSTGREAP